MGEKFEEKSKEHALFEEQQAVQFQDMTRKLKEKEEYLGMQEDRHRGVVAAKNKYKVKVPKKHIWM